MLEEASRRLLAGGDDIGEYAQVLRDIQPWIGEGPASDAGPAGSMSLPSAPGSPWLSSFTGP